GRAGRDGLAAECLLLWSGADYGLWKSILELEASIAPGAMRKLGQMLAFCQDVACRHRALLTYFGEDAPSGRCEACDVCLGEEAAGPLSRAPRPVKATREVTSEPEPHDRALFEALRVLRRSLAQDRGVPPYLVFSDVSLRDMARRRPRTSAEFLEVKGVGEWKAEEYGPPFLSAIRVHLDGGV